LVARVLPLPESLAACAAVGLGSADIIQARGPFSVEDTQHAIRAHEARVLVTKESGEAGGLTEKLEAARREGCRVVLVNRPAEASPATCQTITGLLSQL
jgi:precorrin-6x reductase